jgi:hypothetical protein
MRSDIEELMPDVAPEASDSEKINRWLVSTRTDQA